MLVLLLKYRQFFLPQFFTRLKAFFLGINTFLLFQHLFRARDFNTTRFEFDYFFLVLKVFYLIRNNVI